MTYNRGKGKAVAWIFDHASYEGDECLIFPFSRNPETGYGMFGYLGEMLYAHRFMCELVNGPAPSDEHYASHHCGNGHEGCVNRKHLAWKTPYENAMDRLTHTGNSEAGRVRAKLNASEAREIRSLKGCVSQYEIGRLYGVSRETISHIHCDRIWVGA